MGAMSLLLDPTAVRTNADDLVAWLSTDGLRILVTVAGAVALRWLLHRSIKRLTNSTTRASMPALLKPLKERNAQTAEEGQFIPERRRQRAEAIGSVLRSFVTAVVFTMAALLVFGELGFNLGPLLASAGIVGVALGFGAQSLVKDLIAGLFMLLEDQYGVGDTVDLGEAIGVVETVGLRITTIRDMRGVLWYIRNGEIVRVGNKSQGWALVVIDIPIGFVNSEEAIKVLRAAAETVAGVLAKLDGEGVAGELRVAEVREGRSEVVQMWGRPESVREEFRERRAL